MSIHLQLLIILSRLAFLLFIILLCGFPRRRLKDALQLP